MKFTALETSVFSCIEQSNVSIYFLQGIGHMLRLLNKRKLVLDNVESLKGLNILP